MKLIKLILVVATLQLPSCEIAYSYNRDGKGTRAFTAGFNPDFKDIQSIKDLRR